MQLWDLRQPTLSWAADSKCASGCLSQLGDRLCPHPTAGTSRPLWAYGRTGFSMCHHFFLHSYPPAQQIQLAAWQQCKWHRGLRSECQVTNPASNHHSYLLRGLRRNHVHIGFDSIFKPCVWVHLPALHPWSQCTQTNVSWADNTQLSRTQNQQRSSTNPENSNHKKQGADLTACFASSLSSFFSTPAMLRGCLIGQKATATFGCPPFFPSPLVLSHRLVSDAFLTHLLACCVLHVRDSVFISPWPAPGAPFPAQHTCLISGQT